MPNPQGGYSLGDVFFAEVAIAYAVCANRGRLFEVKVGERMECELDRAGFEHLVRMFLAP